MHRNTHNPETSTQQTSTHPRTHANNLKPSNRTCTAQHATNCKHANHMHTNIHTTKTKNTTQQQALEKTHTLTTRVISTNNYGVHTNTIQHTHKQQPHTSTQTTTRPRPQNGANNHTQTTAVSQTPQLKSKSIGRRKPHAARQTNKKPKTKHNHD